jgi:hypothetical protein
MFGFLEIITGAKQVVPLVPGVIEIVEKLAKQKEDPNLARILQQVRLDTLEGARELRGELIALLQDKTLDSQLDVSLKQIGENLSWIRDPLKKRRVQKYRDRINEIHRNLTSSTDDLAGILACMQRTEGLGTAYEAAEAARVELDGLLQRKPSVREVLETYIKFIDAYIVRLQS